MKTTWPVLLVLVLLASPAAQAQFTFTTNNGTITITGYTGSGGAVTIPASTNGLAVTTIANQAFDGCTSLTSVAIPNSVTSIGQYAFDDCTGLTSVTIPASVTNFGHDPFGDCSSLTTITVVSNNPAYSSLNGVLFDKSQATLINYPGGLTGNYSIPASVTSIGYQAFDDCPNLTSVTIPNSVTNIFEFAFDGCTSLTSVTIPVSVTSIGEAAFGSCPNLAAITADSNNSFYASVGGVLFNQSQTTLVEYPDGKVGTSYTIPNSITNIGDWAFYEASLLTSVVIPSSVTSIGVEVFSECFQLTSVTIPSSVASIGAQAFFNSGLTSVTIGTDVTNISSGVFEECQNLTKVYFQGNAPTADLTTFEFDNYVTAYYLPGTTGWSAFSTATGVPVVPWFLPNPMVLNSESSFGLQSNVFGFTISWATNTSVVVQACTNLANPVWSPVATNPLTGGSSYFSDPQWTNYHSRFYRLSATSINSQPVTNPSAGMALIPAGSFTMGDPLDGEVDAMPIVTVTVSAFYMDTNLVTYSQWQSVYNWAASQGYGFDRPAYEKGSNYPVSQVDWYSCVKWCNARSQQAGLTPVYYTDTNLTQVYTNGDTDAVYPNWAANGYRLPTEAEWEKAARGGLSGQRFPWGDTISESQANYVGNTSFSYDLGPNGDNAAFDSGAIPYTSPVGYFAANGYGLYDMAGNSVEWCWDWYGTGENGSDDYVANSTDPRGPPSGTDRVMRGGCWGFYAYLASCAYRLELAPSLASQTYNGFRCVRGL